MKSDQSELAEDQILKQDRVLFSVEAWGRLGVGQRGRDQYLIGG